MIPLGGSLLAMSDLVKGGGLDLVESVLSYPGSL
jgi:hypothetical protein